MHTHFSSIEIEQLNTKARAEKPKKSEIIWIYSETWRKIILKIFGELVLGFFLLQSNLSPPSDAVPAPYHEIVSNFQQFFSKFHQFSSQFGECSLVLEGTLDDHSFLAFLFLLLLFH